MDTEFIKALATLPMEAILLYLIIRQQSQIEKLLAGMIESEREHARNLVAIMCDRGSSIPVSGFHNNETQVNNRDL